MRYADLYVYIASPFFNKEQLAVVLSIETVLQKAGVKFFSPRSEGILVHHAPEDRAKYIDEIYRSNIQHLLECNAMLAVVDGRDIGTIFEIGFFTARKLAEKDLVLMTFTNNSFGLNVMLQKSVDAHLKGTIDLKGLLALAKYNNCLDENQFSFFRGFNENVT